MEPGIVTAIIPQLLTKAMDISKAAEIEELTMRLIKIELRSNICLIDACLPSNKKLFNSEMAVAVVEQLRTDAIRSLFSLSGLPPKIINKVDQNTKNLILLDKSPKHIRPAKKNSCLALSDIFDYLIRKELEMKSIAKVCEKVGFESFKIDWQKRITNFRAALFFAIKVI